MGKTFQCRDAGVVCGATVRGETEEEVLTNAIVHARDAHGVDLAQSKALIRYALTVVREEDRKR